MTLKTVTWMGRHKRISRRLGRDLRYAMPFLMVALCFVSSATAIMAAERGAL
jgi:predicted DNA repair protein MutK